MHGFLVLLPFFVIRWILPFFLHPKTLSRAAYFAPMYGGEKWAYIVYQLSNIGIFVGVLFLDMKWDASLRVYFGTVCYLAGLSLLALSILHFSMPDETGRNAGGIYRFSRHPMYVAYFICFLGMLFWRGRYGCSRLCWCSRSPRTGSYLQRKDGAWKCLESLTGSI